MHWSDPMGRIGRPAASDHASLGRIRVDLRIGITGHRWISPEDGHVRRLISEAIIELARNIPDQSLVATATGVTLVSALAEGADRIAAHVALDLGARLEVVLPLHQREYEE